MTKNQDLESVLQAASTLHVKLPQQRGIMTIVSGIFSKADSASEASAMHRMDAAPSSSSSSNSDSATISSNDFLTLLVTEMQNQDPTADTDPNEYINQLVNVNSLEQLISINQTLSAALGSTASSPDVSQQATNSGVSSASAQVANSGTIFGSSSTVNPSLPQTNGNLSAPPPNAAADRIAHALSGRSGVL
jgi:flagellar basal-body rod modification protein FlgD